VLDCSRASAGPAFKVTGCEPLYSEPSRPKVFFPLKIVTASSEERFVYEGLATRGYSESLKGKGMAGSGSTRATVCNKPGVGVRKMEATRWLAALFFLMILFASIYLVSKNSKTIATLGILASLVVFVGILYWVQAMGDKAEAYSKGAVDARQGDVAEEAVGNLLGELPAGNFVVHDFESKKGNIDHIIISKKGILTVETKSHRGIVTCEGDLLKCDGKPFEKDFIKQAWAQAYSIRDLLTEKGVCNLRPQPVIVFTDADVQVNKKVRGVHVIGIKEFHAFLEGLPTWMSERLSKGIIDCLLSTQLSSDMVPKPKVAAAHHRQCPTPKVAISPYWNIR